MNEAAPTIRAVERAIDVLRCFTAAAPTLSVTDLQRELGLSRPVLYRLLHTLEGRGLIRSFGEPQRFELAHGVLELAQGWLGGNEVAVAAKPYLTALWNETDETVALSIPAGEREKLVVEELRSRQALMFTRGAGLTEDVAIGASGKAILAFYAAAALERALDGRPDRRTLERSLAMFRTDGFGVSTGEVIEGAISIAAPIFNASGEIAGSVSLFGPEARIRGDRRENFVEAVRKAGREISEALGYRETLAAE